MSRTVNNQCSVYGLLCSLLCVISATSNLVYKKFIILQIMPGYALGISSGALMYPLTYFLVDIITELYGKETARKCLIISVLNCISIIFALQLINFFKATSWSPVSNDIFHLVFGSSIFSLGASFIAYSFSQNLDILIYVRLKRYLKDHLGIVSLLSSSLSLLTDTCIVVLLLSLVGIVQFAHTKALIIDSFIFKVVVSSFFSLFFSNFVRFFRRRIL